MWYEGIVSQVLALQSEDGVDVVSRATYSSNAIITGVQEALGQAVSDGSFDQDEDENTDGDNETVGEDYIDGLYSAQALCTDEDLFSYWLQVDVTIQDGLITGVDIAKYDDDSDDPESNEIYLNYAIYGRTYRDVWYEGIVSQVLALQSGDGVDVVSRATYSSNAIISGVQEALAQASAAEDKEVLS
ncbi:MAG: FMN-binding protein [Clostridiales bacterium]|nr:FMN-binding protein [Clostridiales bacterium]